MLGSSLHQRLIPITYEWKLFLTLTTFINDETSTLRFTICDLPASSEETLTHSKDGG